MHHAHFHARIVLRLHLARIWHSRFLFNRQGVEFGSDEHCRAWTILHHCHDAVASPLRVLKLADAFGDCESEFAQLASDEGGRLFLAMR